MTPYSSRSILTHLQISRLFIFDPFEVEIGYRRYDQRQLLDRHIRRIETKTPLFRQTQLFQPEIQLHHYPLVEWQLIVLAQVLFHHDELEIPHYIVSFQRFIPAGDVHLPVIDPVFHHLREHQADLWLDPETKPELYPDDIVGYDVIDGILRGIRIIQRIHMHKP